MILLRNLIVLIFPIFCLSSINMRAAEIWVSPQGDNHNPGSREKPLADISFALRRARELRRTADPSVAGGISIILKGGIYVLQEPIVVRPEDAGTASSPTLIAAAPNEKPLISGGRKISGWKVCRTQIAGLTAPAQGKVWVADAPMTSDNLIDFRQLYINDQKALRARNSSPGIMGRILSWNHEDQTCWIPKPEADLRKVRGLEMLIHQWWAIAVLRVKSVTLRGDSARLSFYQPESRIQSEHPWPAPWISKQTGNSAFFLTNAIQFLDEPGEWYLDKINRKIYYWPKKNENLTSARVIIPVLETMLIMQGTADRPVAHVHFKGISFAHSSWLRPSNEGHVPHQSGMYMLDAYKLKIPGTPDKKSLENQAWIGRPPAAAEVSYAHHTSFEGCRFEHLGSTGLDYLRGTHDNSISGNVFKDISGTAIQTGVFSDQAQEVHIPYQPQDEREICTNDVIKNNLLTDIANEDWGAVGIGAGYVRGISIEHNDLSELSYMGISMGWGWTKTINVMRDNHISNNRIVRYGKHMYDVSAIYTLSAQPNSFITGNTADSIYKAPYAHDPNHWFYLYTDEGSSYITVKNNWTRSDKYLQNANGPGNNWENNGPQVADSIKNSAGLESSYRYLLKEKVPGRGIINHSEKMKVVEIIAKNNQQHDTSLLKSIGSRHNLSAASIYQWKNHTVFYGAIEDPVQLRSELQQSFREDQIKIYNSPFYEFNKAKQCPEGGLASTWDHMIFSADLVQDTLLQKEYLNYHQNQLKEWPEVSRGFCNADFQQLQVFKNGDQLMLIISIPKGANLDQLNPRTTANNPRVDEWNRLMKKYQKGISGTNADEVWVPFKKVY